MIEASIPVSGADELVLLLGTSDQHLRRIRDSVPANISTRDGRIHVTGDEDAVLKATAILERLKSTVVREGAVEPEQVSQIIREVAGDQRGNGSAHVAIHRPGRKVKPRTPGQSDYVRAIRDHDLVFCAGPAGTGPTC